MSGGNTRSGSTWPMRVRFSSSARCLASICFGSARCCNTQPAQTPKCWQRGCTRSGDAASTCKVSASSKWRLRPVCLTHTVSPASAPATNTALPSCRPTPRPSWLRSWISMSNSRLSLLRDRATAMLASGGGARIRTVGRGADCRMRRSRTETPRPECERAAIARPVRYHVCRPQRPEKPTSASSYRRRPGTTSPCARWRPIAWRRFRGSALPIPGGRWPRRSRDTRPCGRGCRRPPTG